MVGLTHFYPKDLMALITSKTNGPVGAVFCRETAKTQNGVFAEDTLPLNVRAYELPNITIYTAEYLYAYFCLPYKARMPADTTS